MAKILIVDDDPDIVEASQLFLEKEGHTVASAGSRAGGMAQVEAFQPDLLILDVMMEQPDDGFVMAQELRRLGKRFPILMLTSVATASGLAFGKDDEMVPVDEFIPKPVDPATLVKTVATLLAR
ncbi:MAG: Alkaline phosphatase synthesis transcriptional regulatory protein PhoP [Acidobacteria bacterium ADurb.Bin340]|nr:MAG: Alkaline phosphatase synthesis transcriptional regulatory protein PhoP [Acidobacteria bacterium ADurb.Bin340]HOD33793.1 response regulator [Holophaga sp.]HQL47528.1 response regulator [Holophaga sp.]